MVQAAELECKLMYTNKAHVDAMSEEAPAVASPPNPWGDLEDPIAFERFCATYLDQALKSLGRRHANVRWTWHIPESVHRELVWESVTEALLQLRTDWAHLPDRSHPLRYVVAIAQRRLVDRLRTLVCHYRRQASQPPDTMTVAPPDERIVRQQAVGQVLAFLPARQAEALQGHYLEERSLRELSVRLQTSEAAVKCLLQRGRSGFREAWDEGVADASGGTA